jgi:two-component system, sensor histidine kinase and response regulator
MASRILIVEDSDTQAALLRTTLEAQGFDVDMASDGKQGLDKFRSGQYDLVISDIVMPQMSGFELCETIKKQDGPHVPVVLLTALRDLKDLIEGLRCGADNFITKPYEPAYLLQRVENIISNRHSGLEPDCDPQHGVCFMDKTFVMNLDRRKILEYLVSTFDDFLRMRQRESDTKLDNAKQKLQLIKQREQILSALAGDLQSPLHASQTTLDSFSTGEFGQLDEKQQAAIAQLQHNNEKLLNLIKVLSESIFEAGDDDEDIDQNTRGSFPSLSGRS